MKKPTSLVTGGAGFIGSHVVDYLLTLGHTVVVLDDLSGGYKNNVAKNALFVKGSILNEKLLNTLFTSYNFDYVFHLAAYAAEGLSHFIRKYNYQNNIIGSVNLINRAVNFKIKRFVFTSSIAVYGENQSPMNEEMEPQPKDPYGIAKYAVELDLKAAHDMFGLHYTIFRPHNVYGERQNLADPYRNVLGIFIRQIMKKEPMTIFGDGNQTRAFSYITDVAPLIAQCVTNKKTENQIYNVGADTPYTVKNLAQLIAKSMGSNMDIEYLPARKEVVNAFSDHAKVSKDFNVTNTVDLETGIKRMVLWAKKYGMLDTTTFESLEITSNLPPSWKKLIT